MDEVKKALETLAERAQALEQYYALKERFRGVRGLLAFSVHVDESGLAGSIIVARDLLTDTHFIVNSGKVIFITESEFKDIEYKYEASPGNTDAYACVVEIIFKREGG